MECPVCEQWRPHKYWSERQWEANGRKGSPFVVVDGWQRNCCKKCSDEEGYYFRATPAETERGSQPDEPNIRGAADEEKEHSRVRHASPLTPPPSATCPLTREDVEEKWEGASKWLQKNMDVEFWEKAENMWNDQNQKYRTELEEVNAALGFKRKKNGMKHFSYWGAVKVDDWAMKWSSPGYAGYADIGNNLYASVFKKLWGKSHISKYSDATIGDHVEALLGWFIYMSSRPGFEFEERVHDIIDMLNQALFSAWVLGTFFPSDR